MLRGGAWLFGSRAVERSLGLARIVVLARLLTPHDFGIIGVALIAMAMVRRLSETGFKQALIQRPGEIESYLGTAWAVTLLRNLILAGGMIALAPQIAAFFGTPQARPILQVLAVAWAISGLRNIGLVYLQKELAFRRFSTYHLAMAVTELAVSITLAVILRSVWALVLGYLASNLVGLVLSYFVAPVPHKITVEFRQARELFRFGRWVTATQLALFLIHQLDRAVISKLLGVATLGLYQMAYNLSNQTSSELQNVVARSSFPAFAQLQGRREAVKEGYIKVVQISSLIAVPAATGTVLLADGLTRHVLGEQWLPIVGTVQILAIMAVLLATSRSVSSLLAGLGRPDVSTKEVALRAVVLAAVIYPFVQWWGMPGAAIAVAVSAAASVALVCFFAFRAIGSNIWELLKALAPAVAGSLAIVAAVIPTGELALEGESLARFLALVVIGAAAYVTGLAIWAAFFRWDPRELLKLKTGDDGLAGLSSVAVGETGTA